MNITQGKWEAGYNPEVTGPTTPNVSGPCCGGGDWPYRTVNVGTETIAIIPAQDIGRTHNPTLKEAEANAQLIASAPDMVEALKIARDTIEALHGEVAWDIYDKHSPEMNAINKALARVEGK